jgi:adenylate kinase
LFTFVVLIILSPSNGIFRASFMLNLVLFGPPGAGKGTQSAKLIDKYGLIHLSTGDLLRAEISAGTTLGLEAKKLMDQGILVPDAVVIGMIENKLNENKAAAGFIFDGFPRTVAQAEALDALLASHNLSITQMIALEVAEEELTQRLLERGKSSGRPDDQNESLIRKRVQEYMEKTAPVAGYYENQGKFTGINGVGEIEDIFGQILSIIE